VNFTLIPLDFVHFGFAFICDLARIVLCTTTSHHISMSSCPKRGSPTPYVILVIHILGFVPLFLHITFWCNACKNLLSLALALPLGTPTCHRTNFDHLFLHNGFTIWKNFNMTCHVLIILSILGSSWPLAYRTICIGKCENVKFVTLPCWDLFEEYCTKAKATYKLYGS